MDIISISLKARRVSPAAIAIRKIGCECPPKAKHHLSISKLSQRARAHFHPFQEKAQMRDKIFLQTGRVQKKMQKYYS